MTMDVPSGFRGRGLNKNNQHTRNMIKKISLMLASLILAVSAVWAGTDTYTATVNYPSNPSVNYLSLIHI